jgi:hypothetical protein
MRDVVFARPSNPYHKLFQWAGCTYPDLEKAVQADGLEATLEKLWKAGVYLSHDEFKGKQAIRRGGREITSKPDDFSNPLVRGTLECPTSGSRSSRTFTRRSLECQIYHEAQLALGLEESTTAGQAFVGLMPMLPSTAGLRWMTYLIRRGYRVDRWFSMRGRVRDAFHYQALTYFLLLETRALGVRIPLPVSLPENDFLPVAQWIARRQSEGVRCILRTSVSPAVRVAAAALEGNLDISGAQFLLGGEALTDAKRAVFDRAGVEAFPRYGINELGPIGWACRHMNTGNCVHVFRDSLALVSRRRTAPLSDVEVDSLLFTTLLPYSPLVLVNAEMDDSGVLGPARCDCSLTALGLTQQVSNIYSYGKLTGQGMTLVGSDVLRLLEEVLPNKFGGTPVDYQLVEQEGAAQTEVELRVHPRIHLRSTDEVKAFFLAEIRKLYGGALTFRSWTHTDGLHVVAAEPYVSGGRKVLPLHLLGPRTSLCKTASKSS